MKLQLIDVNTSNDPRFKSVAIQKNLNRLYKLFFTPHYETLSSFERFLVSDAIDEQLSLKVQVQKDIEELENMFFGYGV